VNVKWIISTYYVGKYVISLTQKDVSSNSKVPNTLSSGKYPYPPKKINLFNKEPDTIDSNIHKLGYKEFFLF
jgi:hypothetical protein